MRSWDNLVINGVNTEEPIKQLCNFLISTRFQDSGNGLHNLKVYESVPIVAKLPDTRPPTRRQLNQVKLLVLYTVLLVSQAYEPPKAAEERTNVSYRNINRATAVLIDSAVLIARVERPRSKYHIW